jgi:hypothetical protein
MWHVITKLSDLPTDRDLRLAVIDAQGRVHALVFPCRKANGGWIHANTGRIVEVVPTHWQDWDDAPQANVSLH